MPGINPRAYGARGKETIHLPLFKDNHKEKGEQESRGENIPLPSGRKKAALSSTTGNGKRDGRFQ